MKLMFLLAVIAFLKSVFAYKVYHAVPPHELRRRARAKDARAAAIYRLRAYGQTMDLLIYLFGAASAVVLVIWTARVNWWSSVITMLVMAGLSVWLRVTPGGWLWSFGAWLAPFYIKILSFIRPVLEPVAKFLPGNIPLHAGIYEKEDLLELLSAQNKLVDNRIDAQDLKIAASALSFGDKKVSGVMTPLRKIHFVSEDEIVGPTLMDELHKTGFSRFPVVKGSAKASVPNVVGTLYLKDAVEIVQENKGKVKDLTRRGAYFINESCDLRACLDAILKKQHHQLIVVNNFEETVGVITLEDVLEQILGQPITDEFDKYEDLRAVASIDAERERAARQETEAPGEPAEQPAAAK